MSSLVNKEIKKRLDNHVWDEKIAMNVLNSKRKQRNDFKYYIEVISLSLAVIIVGIFIMDYSMNTRIEGNITYKNEIYDYSEGDEIDNIIYEAIALK